MQSQAKEHDFEFHGTAREWFGIWITNLLLSIVTLGIYSAWAKVRTKKYFHGNTSVAGRTFDYHATGKQILIGRLIVLAAFVLWQVTLTTVPVVGLLLTLAIFILFPLLIVRSTQFNARMSSFSNVRFSFDGTVGRAALIYLLYPILVAITLYTTFPIWDRARKAFSVENHKLGRARFSFNARLGVFYRAGLLALAWIIAALVIGTAVTGANLMAVTGVLGDPDADPTAVIGLILLFYVMIFAAIIPAAFIYQALIRNEVFNSTELEGGHRFVSDVSAARLFWIAISNMVVVVCTLFLMLPWAQIRMARYLADHTRLVEGSSLDTFLNEEQAQRSAVGDAFTDFEGVDVGLPV